MNGNGQGSFLHAFEQTAAYQEALSKLEAEQEREPMAPDTTPLDVFGDSQVIGSPPLPPGLLPSVIEARARDVAERLGVDPAMVALPMLATCAACLDDRVQIIPLQFDSSWKESARIWIAVIADSGQKKTPAINAALAPLRALERQWMAEDKTKEIDYHTDRAVFAEAQKLQRRAKSKALATGKQVELPELPQEPIKPITRRKEVKDTTIEALTEVMQENSWGMISVQDELTGWFGNFDAYRNAAIKRDRSLYLESYNGGGQIVDRISRGRAYVPNWSLSLIGGIQPDAMRKIAGHLTDDGLAQRFSTIFCHSDGLSIDRPEDEQARVNYENLISRLVSREIGGPEARVYCRFAPDAQEIRDLMVQRVHQVMCMPWVTKAFQTHLSKWEGLFPRFCLTWHAILNSIEHPLPDMISRETALQVSGFMLEYLLPHAARFYTEILQSKEEEHYARWIAGHILAHDLEKITVRDIGRVYRALRGDIREIQKTLEILTSLGWTVPNDNGTNGGHRQWKVNPEVHRRFGAQKRREKLERAETIRKIQEAVKNFPALGARTVPHVT